MIVRVLIMLVFCGFACVMLYVGFTQYLQQRRLLSAARAVEAEIIESRVEVSRSADTDNRPLRDNSTSSYRPVVRFRYRVGQQPYVSDMLRPTIILRSYASKEAAQEELTPYPQGAVVTAHVCDDEPSKGFLIAEASVGPVVFMIVGLIIPPIVWFISRYI